MSGSEQRNAATPSHGPTVQEKMNPDKLARKRALDRKAQQAARNRSKLTIANLQFQVDQLNNALVNETSRLESLLQQSRHETERVRAENQALQLQLDNALSRSCRRTALDRRATEGVEPVLGPPSVSAFNLRPFESLPWNSEPTCQSDKILQDYVARARCQIHATMDIFLSEQPDVSGLLTRARSTDQHVSSVVSDVVLAYAEIDTLPKKAACLYVMYKLLNWLIYRTKTTYDQIPPWLRPVPLQFQIPHPAWIDRIPWPNARVYLIQNPTISFDDFASSYSSSFDLYWPYEELHVLLSLSQTVSLRPEAAFNDWFPLRRDSGARKNPSTEDAVLNPVFEQHLRRLENWSVSDKFRRNFPALGVIIDNDSRLDFQG
ncbi:hypothetical protein FB567DRAFT_62881 [Paraphoma chrysanthemicola]|uniref:BZIP transcription factor n=1 Tax=Paraphoma chrysanthemicola TaxID=798071 RepID=A0A8K0R482_9PLEO|nr:hypothetical protein FB567DRAFT_62881 [Paraphoma chrysanthemicola]